MMTTMADVTPEEREIYRIAGLTLVLVVVQGIARRWIGDAAAWAVASFVFMLALYFALARPKEVAFPLYLLFATAASGFTYAVALLVGALPEV